jgi:UDP-N-acetylbacillosamine N-acetyltransferase
MILGRSASDGRALLLPCATGHAEELMPSSRKLVIWGAGGHAKVVADIISLRGEYVIAGFLEDAPSGSSPGKFLGVPVYYGLDGLDRLQSMDVAFLILGFGDCGARLARSDVARARRWSYATALHPSAVIASSAEIGAGTVVAAGAVVNPEVRLGEHVIINTSASVDHECVIGDAAHVGPGAHLAGRVTVGRATFIGIGAIVLPGVKVGAESEIGAGSLVLHDVPDGMLAFGSPARVVRPRTARPDAKPDPSWAP